MSVSSHNGDKEEKDKDIGTIKDPNTGKKYVKIYRIEATREFILLMFIITALLAVSLYNPYQLVQNTDRIISNQERNWIDVRNFIDNQENSRISSGADLVKLLFLFSLDGERDLGKLMEAHDLNNTHFVDLNSTHYITEKGSFPLPYNLSFANLFNHTGLTD